ncbi:Tyrosine-protein phosphatase non-receptor type 3 [Bagarius yarrelli]|uniref:Tyrosine-protein phosphatase non-receptor type 3 n=1 Tax=Bagarius yarrelli TaxID=175774 RepID=A0A556TM56_BAGYA|nr:Tyrosine-protein phosphatase non-receptor type 3 [Bagarius yarrelli]
MTSPWCALGNKITSLGLVDLHKRTHMSNSGMSCVVIFPDSTSHTFTVGRHDAGHVLFDLAFEHLSIIEKQYFGLQITEDPSSSPVKVSTKLCGGAGILCCSVGLSPSEAELCYLNTARTLELYGVELHSAQGEVGQQVVSVSMPSSRSCKNLWRSCVDHHTFYNRKNLHAVSKPRSVPLCRKLVGEVTWNPLIKSLSTEHLETKSLPSRSPPSTPNWRSPRMRHDFRKPRPSSVDNLTNDMCYVTESEDVFYTYRKAQEDEKPKSLQSQSDDNTLDEEDWQCLWDKDMAADGELLLIRFKPDKDGKFGFNVKGGVDQKMPLAISHVNPNSPAGRCVPALLEGDQVLLINGRDISEHTHQQVVMYIKASRESHSKELALLVRRKGISVRAETSLQFAGSFSFQEEVPPSPGHPSGETLQESMNRLERGLTSGTLLMQFEKLYKKKAGLVMSCAKLSENMEKNRYKDVLPCNFMSQSLMWKPLTLWEPISFTASHSAEKVTEPAGTRLGYVAAQGPLPNTCTHFWRSVWEQDVSVIIMLTTLTERGRLGEQRTITHLQYVAWPDHGVPDDSSDFLDFVQAMRRRRKGTEPLMVHCSAGIGRTGVLITMETALILMERAQPVYPLEIVASLREQRAMMVQTSCQFSFVCQAILHVYREKFKHSQISTS